MVLLRHSQLATDDRSSSLKQPTYRFTCNLVLEPPKVDRFYMDMRVYSVVPSAAESVGDESQSLVWRGIYLAFEVNKSASKDR